MQKAFQTNAQQRIQKVTTSYEATVAKLTQQLKDKDDELVCLFVCVFLSFSSSARRSSPCMFAPRQRLLNKLRVEQKDAAKREELLVSSAFYEIGMVCNISLLVGRGFSLSLYVHFYRPRPRQEMARFWQVARPKPAAAQSWLNKQRAKAAGGHAQ